MTPTRKELLFPSDFKELGFPFDSTMQKTEAERVAMNIMVILARTQNTFRLLSWDEYKIEREGDNGHPNNEQGYFDKVVKYCQTKETAQLFSPSWRHNDNTN